MEAVKIITPPAERKPCVCVATLYTAASRRNNAESKCGAARATAARAG